MTPEQMEYRAQQAEHLLERYRELERERESAGLYEEALEARRLRLEQECIRGLLARAAVRRGVADVLGIDGDDDDRRLLCARAEGGNDVGIADR